MSAYRAWQDGSAIIIDVREDKEIAEGMAAPALWIPTTSIKAEPETFGKMLASVTRSRQIIFYCGSGRRAAAATERAIELGYQAANMGGFSAWVGAGLPTRHP